MTRERNTDFEKLVLYLEDYELASNLTIASYAESLKMMHKLYFGLLSWHAEAQSKKAELICSYPGANLQILELLSESVSDIGAAMFNWLNGSDKTARVMLRVGLENFVRAISSIDKKEQLAEKSVFKMFATARLSDSFNQNAEIRAVFELLHSDYKRLCKDAHTANRQNMDQLSSLVDLPRFSKTSSKKTRIAFVRVAKNMTAAFCLVFRETVFKMHHRNRENALESLPSRQKAKIYIGET